MRTVSICLASVPGPWQQKLDERTYPLTPGTQVLVSSPSITDAAVFGQLESPDARGVIRLDLASRRIDRIATFAPNASGIASMVAEGRWAVWTIGNSSTDMADWSLVAWDDDTRSSRIVDSSPAPDRQVAFGPQPLPALRDGALAWTHYLPKSGAAPEGELRVLDLPTRSQRVIARGRLSSPAFAAGYLIWAAQSAVGTFSMFAVDAKTYAPVKLPDDIATPTGVGYIAGSEHAFAWTTPDGSAMTVWDLSSGERTQFRTVPDLRHFFQFVQLRWPFAVWFGTVTHTVLDLRTGSAFDVEGTVGLGPRLLAHSDRRGVGGRIRVAAIDDLPPVGGCQPGR